MNFKPKNKINTILSLSVADIGLAVYTYFTLNNFQEFKKILENSVEINSPELQLELYKVFLQTILFLSITMIVVHLVIYFFFLREKKYAKLYVKYYSLLAAISLLISTVTMKQISLLIPTCLYFFAFYSALKFEPLTKSAAKSKIAE